MLPLLLLAEKVLLPDALYRWRRQDIVDARRQEWHCF
jgi:hypothetical protein